MSLRSNGGTEVGYSPLNQIPSEFLHFRADALNFTNDEIAHVNQHAEKCTVSATEILMDPGSCPGSMSSASTESGLPSVTITAPQGYKLTYRTVEERRSLTRGISGWSCGSYSMFNTSGTIPLQSGESVTLRPQKTSIGTSSGIMYRKRIQLVSVVATTKKCPDGTVVMVNEECPPPPPPPPYDESKDYTYDDDVKDIENISILPSMDMKTIAIVGGVVGAIAIGAVAVVMLKK